jgi:nucleoside-diphosphate-sugar epimerase
VRNVWQILSGQDIPPPLSPANNFVDVRDVARLFLWAVEHSDQANGERYIAHAGRGSEQRIADVLREHYSERRDQIKEGIPGQYPPDIGLAIDSSKAVKATGHDFIQFDKSVLDAAKSFEVYL